MLLGIALIGCNINGALTLACAALFMNGAISASYIVNHTDISPIFAGKSFATITLETFLC